MLTDLEIDPLFLFQANSHQRFSSLIKTNHKCKAKALMKPVFNHVLDKLLNFQHCSYFK